MSLYSVLITISIYCSAICLDLCPYVVENGKYRGLLIYKQKTSKDIHNHIMFNNLGWEWVFNVILHQTEENGQSKNVFSIRMKDDTLVQHHTYNIVNRYSTYNTKRNMWTDTDYYWCDCEITYYPGSNEGIMKCLENTNGKETSHKVTDSRILNRVILNSDTGLTTDTIGEWLADVMMFTKDGKYDPILVDGCASRPQQQIRTCPDDFASNYCGYEPKWVRQMNLKLFKSIEGVADYKFKEQKESGHLLLFNINGRPKICFTRENEDISQECNNAEKMTPIFEECFEKDKTVPIPNATSISVPIPSTTISEPVPITNNTTDVIITTTTEEPNANIWICVGIGVLILEVIVVILIIYCCHRKKKGRNSNNIEANKDSQRKDTKSQSKRSKFESTKKSTPKSAKTSTKPSVSPKK